MPADLRLGVIEHLDWMGGWPHVSVVAGRYGNDSLALVLVCEDGEPLCTATVNLQEYGQIPGAPNRAYIRLDGEHDGLAVALRRVGVLNQFSQTVTFGPFDTAAEEVELAEGWRPR
jgi:hypothetical protein